MGDLQDFYLTCIKMKWANQGKLCFSLALSLKKLRQDLFTFYALQRGVRFTNWANNWTKSVQLRINLWKKYKMSTGMKEIHANIFWSGRHKKHFLLHYTWNGSNLIFFPFMVGAFNDFNYTRIIFFSLHYLMFCFCFKSALA